MSSYQIDVVVLMVLQPIKAIALRLGIEMRLFDAGAKALERGENMTLEQLSQETKCEALLISSCAIASTINIANVDQRESCEF